MPPQKGHGECEAPARRERDAPQRRRGSRRVSIQELKSLEVDKDDGCEADVSQEERTDEDPRSPVALESLGQKLSSLLEDGEIVTALRHSMALSDLVTKLVKEVGSTMAADAVVTGIGETLTKGVLTEGETAVDPSI